MSSAIQPAPSAAERLLTIGEAARIVGRDRRVILTALSLGSLSSNSVDRRTYVALSDDLKFKNDLWQSIRLAGENHCRPASLYREGRHHGQA
jgi:hypothetical protein